MRLKWLRVLSFFPQEKRQKSSEDSSNNHISPFREPLTQLNNRPEYLDSDKHVRFNPKINVLASGRPHNPSWPSIFLLMFVTHSSVNPPHRRLLSGVSCPSPLKFPFQITQVTVFKDSLHVRSHEDYFPLLSRLHRGSGSEGARSEASRSEESAPWSICRRRLGSLRAPNFECSRADQSWQVGSFWALSGERFTLPACTELDSEVCCPAVFTNRG